MPATTHPLFYYASDPGSMEGLAGACRARLKVLFVESLSSWSAILLIARMSHRGQDRMIVSCGAPIHRRWNKVSRFSLILARQSGTGRVGCRRRSAASMLDLEFRARSVRARRIAARISLAACRLIGASRSMCFMSSTRSRCGRQKNHVTLAPLPNAEWKSSALAVYSALWRDAQLSLKNHTCVR